MKHLSSILCTITLMMGLVSMACAATTSGDLVLAENGASRYQIVIPDHAADPLTDQWLLATGKLMQAAFQKNGFAIPVVTESKRALDKPGIYLGATDFARKQGIRTDFDDWTYVTKVVGEDLVIAGNDHQDGNNALLGSVKGACDFLREYAGVRFLFMNESADEFRLQDGHMPIIKPDGSLNVDTRSIAFTPVKQIAVPVNLNVQKEPLMIANQVIFSNPETFYMIANNFFPMLDSVKAADVRWPDVVPLEKYGKSHPEYFALMSDGKRVGDPSCSYIPSQHGGIVPLSVANPDVQSLMVQAVEDKIKAGATLVHIGPVDRFSLDFSNDAVDNQLFGMTAKNSAEIRARGESGKLWQVYFNIANRVRKDYPKAKLVLADYQDTPINSDFIRQAGGFPENVMPQIQYASVQQFDVLKGLQTPAGVSGYSEMLTGFSYMGRFAPERTPEYVAGIVKELARYHIVSSRTDGAMGGARGLQAPAYYVYGRMFDDPSANYEDILQEFYTAAFGKVAPQMAQFYDLQDRQLKLFSDYLDWGMPLRQLGRDRVDGQGNEWYFLSVYTPEYLREANDSLTLAEKNADSPDLKARLHLIRLRFNYLQGVAKILTLQNAWEMNPTQASLEAVLDAVDAWRSQIVALLPAGPDRFYKSFARLADWPEMKPFPTNNTYQHVNLLDKSYQQSWYKQSFDWDTAAIRAGILTNPHTIKVATVTQTPAIDSKAWDTAPMVEFVRKLDGMPILDQNTTLKVLRDTDNLYVRVDVNAPRENPGDLRPPKTEKDTLKQEYVDLAIRPSGDGPLYRLAGSPVNGGRYDAVLKPKSGEDASWNGQWEFSYIVDQSTKNTKKRAKYWVALFKIPFSAFGVKVPTSGDVWDFNAGRAASSPMLWSNGQSVTDPKVLGKLEF